MHIQFLNGPVQNGVFDFHNKPGKAVGARIAAALNSILGRGPAPHLWNTVTLDGDLRHRRASVSVRSARSEFEADLISAKYSTGCLPPAGVVTDADAEVEQLALEMIDRRLRTGLLRISREAVPTCQVCGHMAGHGARECKVCGGLRISLLTSRHLVADHPEGHPALDRADIHADHRRQPLHLRSTSRNVPRLLILSRTRNHGIDLSSLGLPGFVLDPRVGLHVAVLAVARGSGAQTAIMLATENAVNHIAAYGRTFREHEETRLQYALHGHAPYDELAATLRATYETYHASPAARTAFETWFLPLVTLKEKTAVRSLQLPALFKHFIRTYLANLASTDEDDVQALRAAVMDGDPAWVMNKRSLATALLLSRTSS